MNETQITELESEIRASLEGAYGGFHIKVIWHKGRYLVSVRGRYVAEPETMRDVLIFLSAFFLKASVMQIEDLKHEKESSAKSIRTKKVRRKLD
jgi:hypothetical protein